MLLKETGSRELLWRMSPETFTVNMFAYIFSKKTNGTWFIQLENEKDIRGSGTSRHVIFLGRYVEHTGVFRRISRLAQQAKNERTLDKG